MTYLNSLDLSNTDTKELSLEEDKFEIQSIFIWQFQEKLRDINSIFLLLITG